MVTTSHMQAKDTDISYHFKKNRHGGKIDMKVYNIRVYIHIYIQKAKEPIPYKHFQNQLDYLTKP